MPTPDEQQLVPSLEIDSGSPKPTVVEGGNQTATPETNSSGQPIETVLGQVAPPVELNLRYRQSIPRAPEGGDDSPSPQLVQQIKNAAHMDTEPMHQVPNVEIEREEPSSHFAPENQQSPLTVESFFSSNQTKSELKPGISEVQQPTSPQEGATGEVPAVSDHDHNLDIVADQAALDTHQHGGQASAQEVEGPDVVIPQNAQEASYADYHQRAYDEARQVYLDNLQQAA